LLQGAETVTHWGGLQDCLPSAWSPISLQLKKEFPGSGVKLHHSAQIKWLRCCGGALVVFIVLKDVFGVLVIAKGGQGKAKHQIVSVAPPLWKRSLSKCMRLGIGGAFRTG
jgi:hypothetical protein